MVALIIGGSGSGKSEYAENLAVKLHQEQPVRGRLLYLATMSASDSESRHRIQRHQELRADKEFQTIECFTHLEELKLESGDTVLLECISNLVANEMYHQDGRRGQASLWIRRGLEHLAEQAEHLILVGNNVFQDGVEYDLETQNYLRIMAEVQQRAGVLAQQVTEVVCGIPIQLKGEI